MLTIFLEVVTGLAGSLVIAALAYWRGSLSGSGFAAAVVLGTGLYTVSNLVWFGSLIAFFISSSLLSKLKHKRKSEAEQHYEKSGRRDAGQVAANGAVPLAAAVGFALLPHPAWWYAYLGALAAVTADTWATELGSLSRGRPRSILTGKAVDRGASGGVTLAGLLASLLGGCFIGLTAGMLSGISGLTVSENLLSDNLLTDETSISWAAMRSWIIIGGAAGLGGSLLDSLLGAGLQAVYHCKRCGLITERADHCGMPSEHVRGWRWLRNDQVNAITSLGGAVVAMLCGLLG